MQTFSINGQLCHAEAAVIPVADHGLLYGDGVFEGLRYYGKKILRLHEHLDRLENSARALDLELPMSLPDMADALAEVVTASPHEDGYIRLVVTRGVGPLGIDPRQCTAGNVIIIADELTMVSNAVREKGATLIIAGTRRLSADQMDSRVKSLNYLNQILGRLEANAAGADEAVMLNQAGFIAEGTADNLFIVKDGILQTPSVTDGALDGITRAIVLELAESEGISVEIKSLSTYDLYTADECFLTGTGAELIPVRSISGRDMRQCPGPVFGTLCRAFAEMTMHLQ